MTIHTERQIVELEEQLRQAMVAADVTTLESLIAPELLFTNYLGHLVSKQADLEMHRSGVLQLRELTSADRQIQCHEGFSVVSVKMHLLGSYDGTLIDQQMRFTRVWATSSAGSLQIIAGHASLLNA